MPKKKTTKKFIQDSIKVHGDKYDYSRVKYNTAKQKIIIVCSVHGEFQQTPCNHLTGYGCQKCGRNISSKKQKYDTKTFITNAKKLHGDKYDYSKVIYTHSKNKVTIICNIHGEFKQIAEIHMNKSGCNRCGELQSSEKQKYDTKTFITNAIKIHGDKYDYSKVIYTLSKNKVTIICNIHGEFQQTASTHLTKGGCIKCSNTYSYTTCEFIEEAKKIHGDTYNYSKVKYIKCDDKVIIICPHHGEFKQSSHSHLRGSGCKECGFEKGRDKVRLTNIDFIKKAKEVHGDKYDYSEVNYIRYGDKVNIICNKHGIFRATPQSHIQEKRGCQKCNMCPSCGLWKTYGELCYYCIPSNNNKLYKKVYEKSKEIKVVKYLREKLPDYDFIHNQSVGSECTKDDKKNSNGHLFPDIRFDCGVFNLIVEVDEHEHRGADYKCDKQRMYNIIAKLGLPCIFIRYNPDSKESNKDILLEKLKTYLELDIEEEYIWDDFGYKSEYLFYSQPKIVDTPVDIKKLKLVNKVITPVVKQDIKKPKYTKNSLSCFTVKELKDICRTNGIGGYSSMSKSVLIEWMMTKDKIMS